MGSPDSENWRIEDEQLHEVTISSFYIDAYETKQSDYEALLGSDPSTFEGEGLPLTKLWETVCSAERSTASVQWI